MTSVENKEVEQIENDDIRSRENTPNVKVRRTVPYLTPQMIEEATAQFNATEEVKRKSLEKIHDGNINESLETLPFSLPYLTPDMIEEARDQLNETEEVKRKSLEDFRNFISEQKNLVTPTTEIFLLSFLRARKYDLERTYKLFLNYWKFRTEYRHLFDNPDPEAIQAALLRNYFGYLEHRDRHGSLVGVGQSGKWNPEIDSFETVFLAVGALLVLSMEYDASQVAGVRVICDLREISWAQMKYATPSNLALLIRSTQSCFPLRFKGIHVISEHKIVNVFWKMAYPLLSHKLRKRVYLHGGDLKALQEHIHPSVLPSDLGGEAPPFQTSNWKDYFDKRVKIAMGLSACGFRDKK